MSKTLHVQKYACPDCHQAYVHEEWSENDKDSALSERCSSCLSDYLHEKYGSSIYFSEVPGWIGTQKKVLEKTNMGNATSETHSANVIQYEKKKELQTSRRAREYERARKHHWLKNKPEWVRRGRNTAELSQMEA